MSDDAEKVVYDIIDRAHPFHIAGNGVVRLASPQRADSPTTARSISFLRVMKRAVGRRRQRAAIEKVAMNWSATSMRNSALA
jgi:hypothetical protein